jgi:diaminopimelate decarboxylase
MSIPPRPRGANAERTVEDPGSAARGTLVLGGCEATALAKAFGTPLLVIDETALRAGMRRFKAAFTHPRWPASVTYAGKALLLRAIAAIANEEGLIVDVCSRGELETALRAGVPASACIVHGCFKLEDEIDLAASARVRHVVVDHLAEIDALEAAAARRDVACSVLVRVNPGIDAVTHEHVQTGAARSKFGFAVADGQALAAMRAVLAAPHLELAGVHCHLGSQIVDLAAYEHEVAALAALAAIAQRELGASIRIVDVGGGLGIDEGGRPGPTPEAWAQAIFGSLDRHWHPREQRAPGEPPHVLIEPGRAIVGAAGTTLYRIGVRKTLPDGAEALIVDGGMSDNPRPALYGADYSVSLAHRQGANPTGTFTIFGRHCESDRMVSHVPLPDPRAGDVLAVHASGAYTYSMASNYNRFPRPAVVLARDGSARLAARREPLEHVLDLDVFEGEGADGPGGAPGK